jgi:6-phosphogluconolactonase
MVILAAAGVAEVTPATARRGELERRVPFVYVGGYRPEIDIFRLDTIAARLTHVGTAPAGTDPSFVAWDPTAKFLFAGNETDPGRVTAFAIDQHTGLLTRRNDVLTGGTITAHLSVDRTGRWLLVANYGFAKMGSVSVFPIGADGTLGPRRDLREFGDGTMPHFIRTDPTNRFVFVLCKGGPYVAQLRLDAYAGKLTPNQPDRVPLARGSGPRHMDFHPNGRFAYVIQEQGLAISAYAYDSKGGMLHEIQSVPTLPDGAPRENASTADIHVHPSGKWVYGSTRGHNSLVIYAIDAESGRLTLVGHERRSMKRPRNFHIDPTGTLLMVANQDDASITMFRINQQTGLLDLVGDPVPAGANPSFVGVAILPGPP